MVGCDGGLKAQTQKAISCFCMALALIGVNSVVHAQEPAKPDASLPKPAQPAQNPQSTPTVPESEQPGAGAQVRTGSQFVQGGDKSLASRLGRLLADHQFLEMENLLNASDGADADEAARPASGQGKMAQEQRQLFRGILANRENQPQESIRLLEPLLNKLKSAAPTPEEKMLRKTLAEDYLRKGDLAKANQAYLEFEYRFGGSLSADERDEIEVPLKVLPLVYQFPPMSVEAGDPFSLPYDRDALGLTDVPVFVDGQSHDWMLDPTAPFNMICRSTAKEIGLKIADEATTVKSITGRSMQVHATVIPRFTIGTITYRNMTALVFEDADYNFPTENYQVRGVLGYPAVSALGSLTVTAESNIEVQPGEKGERLTTGARFFLDGDRVMAALGNTGDERMFAVDASGQQTYLTSRYYGEHANEFADKKMSLLAIPGSQTQPPAPAYVADSATLKIGNVPVTLHFVQVLTQPLGNAALDDTYGTLGVDALDELKSYTFDYRTMRFAVTTE
jgi:aspartyl protease